jgi:hypothetical protein
MSQHASSARGPSDATSGPPTRSTATSGKARNRNSRTKLGVIVTVNLTDPSAFKGYAALGETGPDGLR